MTPPGHETAADRPLHLQPDSADELCALLSEAGHDQAAVLVTGQGTRLGLTAPATRVDRVLDLSALDGVVAYEPADLTITVQCGMGLAQLGDLLAEHGQWLPQQPYRRRGTVGGLLATAAEGALDLGHGRPRDPLVGARCAHADGSLARSRGRVVKNVAGYDIPRLMVGSHGTLAVLLEASFKLQPLPARQAALVFGFELLPAAFAFARRVLEQSWQPVFVNVLAGACPPQVAVGLDGSDARVDGLATRCEALATRAGAAGHLVLDELQAMELRQRLDDPTASLAFGAAEGRSENALLVRWSGRPRHTEEWLTAACDGAHAMGFAWRADVRPGLGTAWLALDFSDGAAGTAPPEARRLTDAILQHGRTLGAATLLAGPASWRADAQAVWGPAPPDLALMQAVKTALDPDGVFAAGRYVGGL